MSFPWHWGEAEGKGEYHGFKNANNKINNWEKWWIDGAFNDDLYSSQPCLNCQLMNIRRWIWMIKKVNKK